MDVLKLIISFIGGGFAGGVLQWYRANRAEKLERIISSLKDQIQNLYGPLYFFASQNQSYFELNDSFHNAYTIEYVEKKFSDNKKTQENLTKSTSQTLEIANSYIKLVTQNNQSILDILKDNYSLIDRDDIDVFGQFIIDYTRLKIERDNNGKLKTPLEIYRHIGEISFMRPDFIKRIRDKFNAKKTELDLHTK